MKKIKILFGIGVSFCLIFSALIPLCMASPPAVPVLPGVPSTPEPPHENDEEQDEKEKDDDSNDGDDGRELPPIQIPKEWWSEMGDDVYDDPKLPNLPKPKPKPWMPWDLILDIFDFLFGDHQYQVTCTNPV